ncbi:MAG: mechanosensitive ion channel family protein, partial [Acidimicrobiales bacterium]
MITSSQQPPLEDQLISELEGEIRVVHDRWSVGQIGWPDLLVAAGVLVAGVVLAVLTRRLIKRSTSSWDGTAASAAAALSQLIPIGIYLFAAAIVLAILDFSAGPVMILALLAVAAFVSLGPVLENVSSGLMVHLLGSCRPGDTVELDGLVGVVEEINSRTIILVADDGRSFFFPNKQVLEHHVINYSRLGRRRSSISFRLGERSDIQRFAELASEALQGLDCVLD